MSAPARKPRKQNMIRALSAGYAAIGNRLTQDPKLPGEAMAIAVYCLSQVPHWQVSVTQLHQHFGWSRGRILRYLKALCQRAYCARRRARNSDGTVDGMEYVICDDPQKILEIRFEWNREGREADDQLDSDLDLAPRSFFPRVDEQRAVNETAVDSNERNKKTLYPARAGAPPGAEAASSISNHGPGTESEPLSDVARPEARNPVLDEASPAPVAPPATGSARESLSEIPDPEKFAELCVTFGKRQGNRAKAQTAWYEIGGEFRTESHAQGKAFVASIASNGARVPLLADYLRTRPPLWKSFAPPKPLEEKPRFVPKGEGGFEQFARERADEAMGTVLGAKAAVEGWATQLWEFVRKHRRNPDRAEENRLYAEARDILRLDLPWLAMEEPANERQRDGWGMAHQRARRAQKFADMALHGAKLRGQVLSIPTHQQRADEMLPKESTGRSVRDEIHDEIPF